MKKYIFLAIAICFIGTSSRAAVGDTTWVQGNITNLDYYGTFDTVATFPTSGTFRKIYMMEFSEVCLYN